jgi:lipoprotein-anchoring transpeptidase ErfK/SrfK
VNAGGHRVPIPALAGAIAFVLLAGVALAVARSGDGEGEEGRADAPSTTTTVVAAPPVTAPVPRISRVAQAIVPSVGVFPTPGATEPAQVLANPQPSGAPLVFLVRTQQPEWLEVLLPTPPSGSTGWIRAIEVSPAQLDYEIVVELGAHRVTVLKSGQVLLQAPIAVGKSNPPPPGNVYYLKELLQLPAPDTVYGSYAFGLSGFSNQIKNLDPGEGVTGLHGTDDPSDLGEDVEGGSIAMSNENITVLAVTLPLGVPVEVRP